MRSFGRYFAERQITQPTPTYARPYLCPDVLIETTRGILKSHTNLGVAKGAMKAPDAPSTAIAGISITQQRVTIDLTCLPWIGTE